MEGNLRSYSGPGRGGGVRVRGAWAFRETAEWARPTTPSRHAPVRARDPVNKRLKTGSGTNTRNLICWFVTTLGSFPGGPLVRPAGLSASLRHDSGTPWHSSRTGYRLTALGDRRREPEISRPRIGNTRSTGIDSRLSRLPIFFFTSHMLIREMYANTFKISL